MCPCGEHAQREGDVARRVRVVGTQGAGVAEGVEPQPCAVDRTGIVDDELHHGRDADLGGHVGVDHLDARRHVLHGERALDTVGQSRAVGDPQGDRRASTVETRDHQGVAAAAVAKIAEAPRVLGDVPVGVGGPLEELHGVALADDTVGAGIDDEVGHGCCAARTGGQYGCRSALRRPRRDSEADGATVGAVAGRHGNVTRVVDGVVAQRDAVEERIDPGRLYPGAVDMIGVRTLPHQVLAVNPPLAVGRRRVAPFGSPWCCTEPGVATLSGTSSPGTPKTPGSGAVPVGGSSVTDER